MEQLHVDHVKFHDVFVPYTMDARRILKALEPDISIGK
jgi:hypothetical protein